MSRRTFDVRGRTVLVTGAARGIGAATARRLHDKGANVVLCGLEPDELERRAHELGDDRVLWREADVTDLAALEAVCAEAAGRFGALDVVVANAGVASNGLVSTIDPAAFDRTIEVNLLGVFRTVRAALPHVRGARGHVLIVSSASALVHTPLMSAYTASKAGVEAFGDALRAEVRPHGVTVGVAYFSFIDTDMVRRSLDRPSAHRAHEMGGALGRIAPLPEAVDAIERGIERRARHVHAPRSVGPLIWTRSLAQPLTELLLRRDRRYLETLGLAEQEPTELTTPQPPRA